MKFLNKIKLVNFEEACRMAGSKLLYLVRIILAIFLFLLTLFVFVYIANEIVLEKETGFDTAIIHSISSLDSPGATSVMIFFTFFGSHIFLFPAYIVLSYTHLTLPTNREV